MICKNNWLISPTNAPTPRTQDYHQSLTPSYALQLCSLPRLTAAGLLDSVFRPNSCSFCPFEYRTSPLYGSWMYTYHPLPFLQYSSLIEFCNQLAWGVFQILKAPILTRPIKIHSLKLWCKVYEIDPFLFVFIYAQISLMFHIHNTVGIWNPT